MKVLGNNMMHYRMLHEYEQKPWLYIIGENCLIRRVPPHVSIPVVSDEEYESIVNTRLYIKDFCKAAVDKIWEILRQEYRDYVEYNYRGPSLCMVCYFSHDHYKNNERAAHYYKLLHRINGVNSINTWMMRHSDAKFTEYQQMMSDFSDVFADGELIK